MLLIESGDKATGQATYYTWDVKKHEFIEGEPFLTYEKEKNGGFWNRIFWEGEKTVCWTEMKNTEFYANVKFSDDVEVIDGGQVFGDEEKYEWTVVHILSAMNEMSSGTRLTALKERDTRCPENRRMMSWEPKHLMENRDSYT